MGFLALGVLPLLGNKTVYFGDLGGGPTVAVTVGGDFCLGPERESPSRDSLSRGGEEHPVKGEPDDASCLFRC